MLAPNPGLSPHGNRGFRRVASPGRMSLGVMFPIESFTGDTPAMTDQVELAQVAEQAGFASLGFRDVPLRDPTFGDIGQVFDPWVYMGFLAAQTSRIALLSTSIVLPLRHPIHTAKAAASLDQLTQGRLLLGVASGDRPVEFPAFDVDRERRGELFREQVALLRTYWGRSFPQAASHYGLLEGADVVPKPVASHVPLFVTGFSQSPIEWIAAHADGWMVYPRDAGQQSRVADAWKTAVEAACPGVFKPLLQSYYIDLVAQADAPPTPIHLGHRLGWHALVRHLEQLEGIGVNHVVLNLKYGSRPARAVLEDIGTHVVPRFTGS